MSNLFSKHLHLCFFKLKYPTPTPSLSPPPHPQHNHSQSPPSTSLLFIDAATSSSAHSTDDFFSSSDDSESSHHSPPDFAAVYSSQRFFFSSPGTSNSIIESPDTRLPCNSAVNALIPRNGVEVPKYSLDPYADFRRSMREMIESRENVDVRKDWDYLHELLLCYLALNPAHTHKYIVRAFTDLVVELLSSRASPPVVETSHCRKIKNRRNRSFSGRLV